MNYRHAYHAGNFADVLKHIVLALVITHLKRKPTPFRVIDTHAGRGLYDLSGGAAEKTGEWKAGIGRLIGPDAEPLPTEVAPLIAPYLDAVRALNSPDRLSRYPGSPSIARAMLRPDDRLIVNELHPEDHAALARLFDRDKQTKVMHLDGWVALKALLPPKERRGVILIDPPFEEPGELHRLTEGLSEAMRRFATGTYLLWYPIKDLKPIARFHKAVAGLGGGKMLDVSLFVRPPRNPLVLTGTGLIVCNPPFGLAESLGTLLPFLADRLALQPGGGHQLDWLSPVGTSTRRSPQRK